MRQLIYLSPLVVAACAHERGASEAVHAASQALVGVDLAAHPAVKTIAAAQDVMMRVCEPLSDPKARTECLGIYAEPLEPKIRRIAEAYDLAATSLLELERTILELERMLEEARRTLKEHDKCGDDC